MQLSEFTYIFLTLCIPFLIYIVRSTNPKKGFSILFVAIISANIFLIYNNFSQIGLFFLAFYLIAYSRMKILLFSACFCIFHGFFIKCYRFHNIKISFHFIDISCIFIHDDWSLVPCRSYD